jgi:hypothetical protein
MYSFSSRTTQYEIYLLVNLFALGRASIRASIYLFWNSYGYIYLQRPPRMRHGSWGTSYLIGHLRPPLDPDEALVPFAMARVHQP